MLMKKLFSLFFALFLCNFAFGQYDVGATNVNLIQSPICANASTPISIKFANYGISIDYSVAPIIVSVLVQGPGSPVTDQNISVGYSVPGNVVTGAFKSVTVGTINFSALGTYTITATTSIVGPATDILNTNDSHTEIIEVEKPIIN